MVEVAIDFGAAATKVAYCAAGEAPRLITFGRKAEFPTAVFVPRNAPLVVADAESFSGSGRVVTRIKQRVNERRTVAPLQRTVAVGVGADTVPLVDLVAAVLSHALGSVLSVPGGAFDGRLVLTHPVQWRAPELDLLKVAARRAGATRDPVLVSEPEAAVASATARGLVSFGRGAVAVFDMGASTLDIAVLRAPADPWPAMRGEHTGGDDLDAALLDLVEDELDDSIDTTARAGFVRYRDHLGDRAARAARSAKEALTEKDTDETTFVATVRADGSDREHDRNEEVLIGREAFEERIEPILRSCAAALDDCLRSLPSTIATATLLGTGGSVVVPAVDAELRALAGRRGIRLVVPAESDVAPGQFVALGALEVARTRDRELLSVDSIGAARALGVFIGHDGELWGAAFSSLGALATVSGRSATVSDPTTGNRLRTLRGHTDTVWSVAFSPTGTLLVTTSSDRTARLWDVASGRHVRTLTGHDDLVRDAAFAPGGRVLATTSPDRTVRLWDVETGAQLRVLRGHQGRVNGVAFSPDGRLLATGGGDATVRTWSPATGAAVAVLRGHQDWVRAVAFSPSGLLLATSSDDATVRVWCPHTGAHRLTLTGHTDWVRGLAFSPEGTLLATAGNDATVRVWDPHTGAHLVTLTGHTRWVRDVAFSPNGRLLASVGDDRTVRVWRVPRIPDPEPSALVDLYERP